MSTLGANSDRFVRAMVEAWDESGRPTRLPDDGTFSDALLALQRVAEVSYWWNPMDRIMFGLLRRCYELHSGNKVKMGWGYFGATKGMEVKVRDKVQG